jgi:beta-phosphoglucomutase-like phosphatase (HAD superfamily)
VTQYIKTIVCLDDIQCPKHDPEPFTLAMKNLAVTQGIAFEDSAAARTSAKAAGLEY